MRSNDRNIRRKERRVRYRKKEQTGNRLCQQPATMNVENPVQRTRLETIQRLEELGKNNPDIAAISGSRYVIVFQKKKHLSSHLLLYFVRL